MTLNISTTTARGGRTTRSLPLHLDDGRLALISKRMGQRSSLGHCGRYAILLCGLVLDRHRDLNSDGEITRRKCGHTIRSVES